MRMMYMAGVSYSNSGTKSIRFAFKNIQRMSAKLKYKLWIMAFRNFIVYIQSVIFLFFLQMRNGICAGDFIMNTVGYRLILCLLRINGNFEGD